MIRFHKLNDTVSRGNTKSMCRCRFTTATEECTVTYGGERIKVKVVPALRARCRRPHQDVSVLVSQLYEWTGNRAVSTEACMITGKNKTGLVRVES